MSLPMLITRDARRDAWVFFGLAVLVLGAGLGLRDPWPADEPRFALVARQMVESGRWLFPMRGDELYPDKPPLFMWMQAATYLVVRSWRVAFLLPSLLCALGTLWLTCDLGRRLWNRRIGLYAGYALLFALQFAYQAKKAQIDPAITFLVTLSVYALLRHLLRGPDWRWYYLGFFAAGLGVITKGVGVIALLVFLPAAFVRARRWPGLHGVGTGAALLGLVAFLGAIGLWLLPMLLAVNDSNDPALQAYADNILLRQTAQRYGNSWHHHHVLQRSYLHPVLHRASKCPQPQLPVPVVTRHTEVRHRHHPAQQTVQRKGQIPRPVPLSHRETLHHVPPNQRTAPAHARHPRHALRLRPGQLRRIQRQTLPHRVITDVLPRIQHPRPMPQHVDPVHHPRPRPLHRRPQPPHRVRVRQDHVVLERQPRIPIPRQKRRPPALVLRHHVPHLSPRPRVVRPNLPLNHAVELLRLNRRAALRPNHRFACLIQPRRREHHDLRHHHPIAGAGPPPPRQLVRPLPLLG